MLLTVLCAVVIALLVRPAWRVVQSAPATLDALDAKVLAMRAQAAQLRAAPVAPAPLPAVQDMSGPEATVTEARDAANAGVTVSLRGVEGPRFAAWLAKPEVQKHMQRLSITRDAKTGRVSGTVVLRTPS